MAAIAEGFTVNAVITLDDYSDADFLGDIIHGRGLTASEEKNFAAVLTLDSFNQDLTIGDLLRANSGSEGFTLKSTISLDDKDTGKYVADIAHSRCIIKNDTGDILSSIILGSIGVNEYLGDIVRSNSGSEGFTLKSILSLNIPDTRNYLADIAHARCIVTNENEEVIGSITLDEESAKEILGDVIRSNSGQEGFTVKASSKLDNYDDTDLVADLFRSIKGRVNARLNIMYYNGKRYWVLTNDKIHYFVMKTGEE